MPDCMSNASRMDTTLDFALKGYAWLPARSAVPGARVGVAQQGAPDPAGAA